jgi:hypothetical protein
MSHVTASTGRLTCGAWYDSETMPGSLPASSKVGSTSVIIAMSTEMNAP